MVHNNGRGVSGLKSTHKLLLLSSVLLLAFAGCGGGGGGSPVGHVQGVLTDGFGSVIGLGEATVSLEGAGVVVGHPGPDGSFKLSAEAGKYDLVGVFLNSAAGIRLAGSRKVEIIKGRILNVGSFQISDTNLEEGWARYRQGNYEWAAHYFEDYLESVRSGQADLGSVSALCGLGWCQGRGMHDPEAAAASFQEALGGWAGNADAWVGLAGCELSRMRLDGDFHLFQAVQAVTNAIDLPGEYSSEPTHDEVSEAEIRAFRCLVNLLAGDAASARGEAQIVEGLVEASGSKASSDVVALVLGFTE